MALSKKVLLTMSFTALAINVYISSWAYDEISLRQFKALSVFKRCGLGETALAWINWNGARAESCFDHG